MNFATTIICLVCQNPLCSLFKYIWIKSTKNVVCPNQYGAFSESVQMNLVLSLSICRLAIELTSGTFYHTFHCKYQFFVRRMFSQEQCLLHQSIFITLFFVYLLEIIFVKRLLLQTCLKNRVLNLPRNHRHWQRGRLRGKFKTRLN